jgi:hypothetical protein
LCQFVKGGGTVSRIRIFPAVSALILTFAILFGGFEVYRSYAVAQPLQTQLLRIPHVLSASVSMENSSAVTVSLGPVPDLQTTYKAIERTIVATTGGGLPIILKDHQTAQLDTAWEALNPIIYQGEADGRFTAMISGFERAAKARGLTARVTMDANDIFVQLARGDAYIYKILPYTVRQLGGDAQ